MHFVLIHGSWHDGSAAETIFVSRNTVAWHLRNVYRKLQIDSREQLSPVVEG